MDQLRSPEETPEPLIVEWVEVAALREAWVEPMPVGLKREQAFVQESPPSGQDCPLGLNQQRPSSGLLLEVLVPESVAEPVPAVEQSEVLKLVLVLGSQQQ